MLARKTPMRRTPFKRGKPKPERLLLPVVPKTTGKMRVRKGPARSPAHLARVRQEPCLVPWMTFSGCQPVEAHHVRYLRPMLGKRVSDFLVAPLCRTHHAMLHAMGEANFWRFVGVDPREWIRSFSTEGARALEEVGR